MARVRVFSVWCFRFGFSFASVGGKEGSGVGGRVCMVGSFGRELVLPDSKWGMGSVLPLPAPVDATTGDGGPSGGATTSLTPGLGDRGFILPYEPCPHTHVSSSDSVRFSDSRRVVTMGAHVPPHGLSA